MLTINRGYNIMKYIILDFDGTIGDSQALIVRTFQDSMRKMGKEVKSTEECANTIGMRLSEAFALLYNTSIEEGERCTEVYRKIFLKNWETLGMKPFPHAVETIKELHQRGFVLAVASSRGRDSLIDLIRQMDFEDCISSVVAQEDVNRVKPEPDMVFKALMEIAGQEMGKDDCHKLPEDLKPMLSETLVVGDMTFDVDMAHNAGAKACAVTYGNGTRELLASAEWIIDDFAELLPLLSEKSNGTTE